MADIQAFRGLRFDLSKVGSLSDVVAPPYDVISVQDCAELYEKNEFNMVPRWPRLKWAFVIY